MPTISTPLVGVFWLKKMKKFNKTVDVITYALNYISGKTLDLGAGEGKYKSIITKKSEEYIAADIIYNKNIDVVCDAADLPFENEEFDTIICTQMLEHVKNPQLVVQQIYRVLKKKGVCVLTAPFLIPSHSDPDDYFRYTINGLKFLFENQGFKIIEINSYGQTFTVFAEWFKFMFSNPYKKHSIFKRRLTERVQKFFFFLDRFSKSKIIYSNIYLIAKK